MFLHASELKEKGIVPAPTSQKAQLKRCANVEGAMLTTGFQVLWQSLPDTVTETYTTKGIESWATIAAVLVCVKKDISTSLAKAAGQKREGSDKSTVSELRFAQLQNAKTPNELLIRLRRIIQQLEGSVNVALLASDIQQWYEEFYQLRPRKADKRICTQWAMDYYRAASTKK
nr:type I-E CRISPR-associated protein Cse2/CasB [Reinekea sp. G2M2-21]